MKIKPAGKLIILILVLGAALGIWSKFTGKSISETIFPTPKVKVAVAPGKLDLPSGEQTAASTPSNLPGFEAAQTDKPEVRMLVWAWNAQMGLMYATGGTQTAKGSLMDKDGVNFHLARQDDTGKMQEALVAFATQLKNGTKNPSAGCHFIAIMGDGSATFLHGINDVLKKLGPEYQAKVIGTLGYSRGEDKLMGPAEWKTNPAASAGGVVAGVIRDGDWNIAQKWLGDNGLRTNPDEKTYDPEAMNWINASDYIDAAKKYVSGYSEDRPVVSNGKRTGEKKHITVQAIVTWTPGDVIAAQNKGGIVSIVSTKEYSSQMPCVVIGIDKWMKENRPTVDGFLKAALDGGEQVKTSPEALHKAAEVSAVLYKEQGSDAAYWEKYYKGTVENDKTGVPVDLGGSSVNNLSDALLTFGMVPGSSNLFAATYKVFGDLVVSQYPELVPSIPDVSDILDTSYLNDIRKQQAPAEVKATQQQIAAAKPVFKASTPIKRVVSRKAWHIQFNSGKATFSGTAQQELHKLMADLLVASDTAVEIHGFTDATGDPNANMALSEARAFAVKTWLEKQSKVNFPSGRIRVFAHGQQQPLAPNTTEAGKAQNRRVEIRIGTM